MVSIERKIYVYDPSIRWGELAPQYRGYQLSNTGLVRSLKFPKKFPYGGYVEPDVHGLYELSGETNKREKVSIDILQSIVKQNGGYTIPTSVAYTTHNRNPIMSSKSQYIERRDRINTERNPLNERVSLKLNLINE